MIGRATQAVFALAAIALTAAAPGPPRAGVYSNVCVSPDTGDVGGAELTLGFRSRQPKVTLKICEGECYDLQTRAVRLSGRTLSFVGVETGLRDEHGRELEPRPHRFVARFRRGGVLLTSLDPNYRLEERMVYEPSQARPSGRYVNWHGRC